MTKHAAPDSSGAGLDPARRRGRSDNGRRRAASRTAANGIVVVVALVLAWSARADLHVYPDDIALTTARDVQSIVVQFVEDNGITRDVTADADLRIADGNLAELRDGRIYPKADGETQLVVRFRDAEKRMAVKITDAGKDRPISFKLDVMPIFMRAGCNAGACHGAARGKDGFHLSLFGYDPDGDRNRIVNELAGRRINLAMPARSLLVEKAAGVVPHTGGGPAPEGTAHHRTLVRWIEAGVPADGKDVATPESLAIMPNRIVLEGKDATQCVTVRATYSDGTTRDVTNLALFLSSNDNSAAIDEHGVITAAQRGEAFVMARFATFTVGAQVIVIPEGTRAITQDLPVGNYIDEHINAKLKKMRIRPSDRADDAVFIRRVYLDVIGRLPPPEAVAAFVAGTDESKREKLIDDLLDRKEFAEMWVMKWSELLQIRSTNQVSYKSTLLYYQWLQEKIASNTPFNEVVQELLSATGGTFTEPATNYYQIETDNLVVAENVAQVFMGMRIQCAQCHNHPFDRWTMDDYYSFVAFFTQIGRKRGEDPRETIVFNRGGGEANHPVGNRVMPPKFLGGAVPDVRGKDRREVLADWLASDENPYFADNLANMVWAHFFGRGIVDPVDDVRVSNPPSNPELLGALAERFRVYNYDFKKLVKDICMSEAYQRSTQPNETNAMDSTNFSKQAVRRVRAEVLLDAITQVTETKDKFKGLPLGARAVQIADGNTSNFFLTTFGRAERATVCSCEVKMEPNLSQALHLINGDTVHTKIRQGGLVQRMLKEKKTPRQIVTDLYQRCVSRPPTESELARLLPIVNHAADKREALEDVFWSLLNSKEFVFNH